jgi:hypothetical protein
VRFDQMVTHAHPPDRVTGSRPARSERNVRPGRPPAPNPARAGVRARPGPQHCSGPARGNCWAAPVSVAASKARKRWVVPCASWGRIPAWEHG